MTGWPPGSREEPLLPHPGAVEGGVDAADAVLVGGERFLRVHLEDGVVGGDVVGEVDDVIAAVALRSDEVGVLDAGDEGEVVGDGEPVDIAQGAVEGEDEAGSPLVADAVENLDVGGWEVGGDALGDDVGGGHEHLVELVEGAVRANAGDGAELGRDRLDGVLRWMRPPASRMWSARAK